MCQYIKPGFKVHGSFSFHLKYLLKGIEVTKRMQNLNNIAQCFPHNEIQNKEITLDQKRRNNFQTNILKVKAFHCLVKEVFLLF